MKNRLIFLMCLICSTHSFSQQPKEYIVRGLIESSEDCERIVNAEILFDNDDVLIDKQTRRIITDDFGRFSFRIKEEYINKATLIEVKHERYEKHKKMYYLTENDDLLIKLKPKKSIVRFLVFDSKTNKPIEGAEIKWGSATLPSNSLGVCSFNDFIYRETAQFEIIKEGYETFVLSGLLPSKDTIINVFLSPMFRLYIGTFDTDSYIITGSIICLENHQEQRLSTKNQNRALYYLKLNEIDKQNQKMIVHISARGYLDSETEINISDEEVANYLKEVNVYLKKIKTVSPLALLLPGLHPTLRDGPVIEKVYGPLLMAGSLFCLGYSIHAYSNFVWERDEATLVTDTDMKLYHQQEAYRYLHDSYQFMIFFVITYGIQIADYAVWHGNQKNKFSNSAKGNNFSFKFYGNNVSLVYSF